MSRLYNDFQPSHYELQLTLDPDGMSFRGSVTVNGRKAGKPSKRIVLHSKDLKITNVSAIRHDKKGDNPVLFDRVNTLKSRDELRLHSSTMLYPGNYTLTITFEGMITDPMNGLYPCTFIHHGKTKKLLATQFESHHAREVFPCIDEPEAKATFSLALTFPKTFGVGLSNTPVISSETKHGQQLVIFETTPIMSTYLLAFVVGEMGFKESKTKRGTVVRAYATPDNVAHLDFAVETATRCLEYYEAYFGIPYPLPKADMVALPDFASGAMENWGLITYREQALLYDKRNTSLSTKQHIAMVIAHELAHMWFGNLVTMRWWTDLWLNEGFASWIEYLAVDKLFPDWGMWTQFITDEQAYGLKLDALEHTHPVEVPIHHPDEIRTIFDAISYQKGSSVIHMLHTYLGATVFRDGLRHYLKKYAYGNTDTIDLWEALEATSGKPVRSFMHAWTSQPGYPIVQVTTKKSALLLHQERFLLNKPKRASLLKWPIPLLGSDLSNSEQIEEVDTELPSNPSALPLINRGHQGFYRTTYDDAATTRLLPKIPGLSPEDRLGLLADSFEAAKAGYCSASDSLKLLSAYTEEAHSSVWDIIAVNIAELRRVMDDDTVRDQLKPYLQRLIAQQYKRLGWTEQKNETYFDKLLRPTILGLGASADHPDILQQAVKYFEEASTSEDLHPDLRSVVYTTIARRGSAPEFKRLLKLYDATQSAEERVTLAAALTNFTGETQILQALGFIKSDRVRLQDISYWLAYSFLNRHAKGLTWKWLKENWHWLEKNLGNDLSFYRTPVYAARSFSDSGYLKEFIEFFDQKRSPALERSINQGIEMLEWQTKWKKRDLTAVKDFLSKTS